jgi:hypothetical protein
MWQLREAILRQRKARSDAKHSAKPLPRRWAELVLYLGEIERTERTKSGAGGCAEMPSGTTADLDRPKSANDNVTQ